LLIGAKLFPIVLLLLAAPIIAELLSGNLPLAMFFSPPYFVFLVALYGTGALLVRELTVRWNKGIACLLLLGMAYGMIEEGLMFSIFFAGGHQLIIVYHAIFSITIPVLLSEIFAERLSIEKEGCWLDNLGLRVCAMIFIGTVVFGITLGEIEAVDRKPFFHYPSSIVLAFIFVLAAKVLPSGIGNKGKAIGTPVYFFIIGLVWSTVFFLLPYFVGSNILSMFVQILWAVFLAFFLSRYDWKENSHKLSLIGGLLFFFVPKFFGIS